MPNATMLIDRLMEYYNVKTISELAERIKIGQPAISKWKKNNYVKAIATKCRELGIYNEIFGDNFNTFTQIGAGSTQIKTQNNTGEGVYNSSSRIEKNTNIDNELLPLFEALSSVANALNKKEHLKKELTNLISKLPTL